MAIKISGNTVIDDSQNISVSGNATANSFVGDGSNLTNLPGGGNVTEVTASGTLADGSKVIVNADGTVSAVQLAGVNHWINTLTGSSTEYSRGIAVDSSGNVHVVGQTYSGGTGGGDLLVVKYNTSGVIQWQRYLGSTNAERGEGIAVDSSGNVYTAAYVWDVGAGGYDALIVKFNSLGVEQWQRTLGGVGHDFGYGIGVDSSGNVYVTGRDGGGSNAFIVAKYDTNGNIDWQKQINASSHSSYSYELEVDSSGNVYIAGLTSSGGASNSAFVVKLNSSGAVQWSRKLYGSGNEEAYGIAVDSSGNVYASIESDSFGNDQIVLAKWNSSGTIQWQRYMTKSDGSVVRGRPHGLAVDSSDNVYVTSTINIGVWDVWIAKFDGSGNILWQNSFGNSSSEDEPRDIVHHSGNIYFTSHTNQAGTTDIITAKLPDDGSGTGTYGNFTYATASLAAVNSSGSLTESSASFTSSNSSWTDQSSSMASGDLTLTASQQVVSQSTNLTSENFIGISDGAFTNGQTATIQLIGSVDDAQSSLTPGQKYYIQNDGTLSETADNPSVFAGTAVSSTSLVVKS